MSLFNEGQINIPGFIDLHPHGQRNSSRHVRYSLIVSVFEKTGISTDQNIDFIKILCCLKRLNGITNEQASEVLGLTNQRAGCYSLFVFLKYIFQRVSAEMAYISFCDAGVGDLFSLGVCFTRETLVMPQKTELPQSNYLYGRYYFFKQCIDNGCFNGNARQELDERNKSSTQRLQNSINSTADAESNPEKQQILSEMVAVKLNLVQLYGSTESAYRRQIITEMLETQTAGLDRRALELTCHSKLAVTASKENDSGVAENHIRETLVLCDRSLPSFATVMALNDVIYAYQELFFHSGNQRPDWFKLSIDLCAQLTYHLLCCKISKAQDQWKRIALLFQAMTYLHISHEFEVAPIESVDDANLEKAEIVIKEVEKSKCEIEIRRGMVLNLCHARLLERKDKQLALAYMEKAVAVLDEGCIRESEKKNLQDYVNLLRSVN